MDPVVKKLLFSTPPESDTENDQEANPDVFESSSPPLALHETEQRYVLGEMLGQGSSGKTYVCSHKVTREIFACKVIDKHFDTFVCHFRVKREIHIMNKLSHPNIVALKDSYQDDNNYYLVMDLYTGGTLSDKMKARGRYTETEAAGVTCEIVKAIKFCHEHGVIHHDLKPENIMFTDENMTTNLKLIDFGLSLMFKPGERICTQHYGAPHYRAPELFLENSYGPEVDVWSVGVILYELLSGTLPFNVADKCRRGWEVISLGSAVVEGIRNFNWKEKLPHISDDAIDILKKMLASSPSARISAEEILAHPWMQNANYGSTNGPSGAVAITDSLASGDV